MTQTSTPSKTVADYCGSTSIAHRKTRKAAQAYMARLADLTGAQSVWNGLVDLPVLVTMTVVQTASGFEVVQTITPAE